MQFYWECWIIHISTIRGNPLLLLFYSPSNIILKSLFPSQLNSVQFLLYVLESTCVLPKCTLFLQEAVPNVMSEGQKMKTSFGLSLSYIQLYLVPLLCTVVWLIPLNWTVSQFSDIANTKVTNKVLANVNNLMNYYIFFSFWQTSSP